MTRKLSFVYTLALLAAICTTLVTPVEASMASHARMIKKRAGADKGGRIPVPSIPVVGVGNDPNATPTDSAGGASGTASNAGASVTKSSGPAPTPTDPFGISIPILGSSSSSSASSTSSSASSSSLASASSSSLASSSALLSSSSSSTPLPTQASATSDAVVFSTVTAASANQADASATNTAGTSGGAADNGGGHLTRNTIIAIVVVAACVGGAIIIWTVIRKWKFAPSDEFGDRLNPIDWRPTSTGDKGLGEEKFGDIEGTGVHRRTGSRGSNRSFVSADAHSNHHGNNNNNMIPDLPAHDFTAGTAGNGAGLAPVGAYADLRRGVSPTPDPYYRGYGATQQQQHYGRGGY